jgi:cytochrome c oxidase subunit II
MVAIRMKLYMALIFIGIIVIGGCLQGGMGRGGMQGGQGGMMQGQGGNAGQGGMQGGQGGMMQGQGGMMAGQNKTDFSSNGERIYYAAVSESGNPISFTMGKMGMTAPAMSCVSCHREDGKGGTLKMMMRTIEVPDIRYETLTAEENAHGETGEGDMGHAPYTEETIKKAITEGIQPDGSVLKNSMPRWNMSEGDLDDLIGYLKTL